MLVPWRVCYTSRWSKSWKRITTWRGNHGGCGEMLKEWLENLIFDGIFEDLRICIYLFSKDLRLDPPFGEAKHL